MTSKSSIMLRYCIIVSVTQAVSFSNQDVYSIFIQTSKEMEILNDLPTEHDLAHYLLKLEKIITFTYRYRHYITTNFAIGLFLINVNLRTIVQMRGDRMPRSLKKRLNLLLNHNDLLMRYFQSILDDDLKEEDPVIGAHLITSLFGNIDRMWALRLKVFGPDLIKITPSYNKKDLNDMFLTWSEYVHNVDNLKEHFPNANISDECLYSLSHFPENPTMQWQICKVSNTCNKMLHTGTEYGYAITHRLGFLLVGRFARGCTIMSASLDQQRIDEFCVQMYSELEYHSLNNFLLPDLSFEIIFLCALEGHVQFIRYTWMEELLQYQRDIGCFASGIEGKKMKVNPLLYQVENDLWQMDVENQSMLGGACNSHATGMAAAAISSYIRYILEKFI